MEDEDDNKEVGGEENKIRYGSIYPRIYFNALKGTLDFHTLRVTDKADKHSVHIGRF
jgi:hypothetical protein